MKTIAALQTKDQIDALKYAFAFMKSEKLNLKECSFINPAPKKFDGANLMPRDMYSASYNDKLPAWEYFIGNKVHTTSPGFSCVASIDTRDQQRVTLMSIGDVVTFNCYGNYEHQAKNILEEIISLHSSIV